MAAPAPEGVAVEDRNPDHGEETRGVIGVGWRPKLPAFQPPELYTIHPGKVVSVMPFGAFVRIEACNRDGLVHVTQIRHATEGERIEAGDEVVEEQQVWVKVIDIFTRKQRYFLSMKYVNQDTGEDLDPQHTGIESEKTKAFEAKAAKESGGSEAQPTKSPGKSPKQKAKKEEPVAEEEPVDARLNVISTDGSQTLVSQLRNADTMRVAASLVSKTASSARTTEKLIAASKAAARKPKGDELLPPNPRLIMKEQELKALKKSLENLRQAGVCKGLHDALNKELVSAGLVAVGEAIRDCACYPDFRAEFGDLGVCETLSRKLGEATVGIKNKLALLQTIRNMAFEDPKNRERLGASGVCDKVTLLLRPSEDSNKKSFSAAAQSVRDLCRDSPDNRKRFLDAGACKALILLLAGEFQEGVGASEAAKNALGAEAKVAILQAIRHLAYDFPDGREQFGVDGACEAIGKVFDAALPTPTSAAQWNVIGDCAQAISYLSYNHDANRSKLAASCLDRIKLMHRDKVPAFVRPNLQHASRMLSIKPQ